jgi:hypothetical protein
MRRMAATLLLLLAVAPGLAAKRGPVCRETSVVDEIAREVRAGDYYADVDRRLVTEQPTADPRFVRCRVCVLVAPFDTLRFGDRPIAQCISRGFEVQILSDGFVVRALP